MARFYCVGLPLHYLGNDSDKTPIINFFERKLPDLTSYHFDPTALENWNSIDLDADFYASFWVNPITHIIELGTVDSIVRDKIRDFYNRAELIIIRRPVTGLTDANADENKIEQVLAKVNSAFDFTIPTNVPPVGSSYWYLYNKFTGQWEKIK